MKFTLPNLHLTEIFVKGMQAYLPDVRIVHVQRNDIIARFASLKKAMRTGTWHRRAQDRRQNEKIAIDSYNFAEYVLESIQVQRLLRDLRSSHDVLCLSYEDVILQGDLPMYAPLFKFIGVEPVEAMWLRDQKLSPPPEEYVRNYQELVSLNQDLRDKVEKGRSPVDLRKEYCPPFYRSLWSTVTSWGRRPLAALCRMLTRHSI